MDSFSHRLDLTAVVPISSGFSRLKREFAVFTTNLRFKLLFLAGKSPTLQIVLHRMFFGMCIS